MFQKHCSSAIPEPLPRDHFVKKMVEAARNLFTKFQRSSAGSKSESLSSGIFRSCRLLYDPLDGFPIAQQIEGSTSRFQAYSCNPIRDKPDQFRRVGLHIVPPPSLRWCFRILLIYSRQPERLAVLGESFQEMQYPSLFGLGPAYLPTFLTDGLSCQF